MLQWWTDWRQKEERRKFLLKLYRETEKNWESVHVMHQRGVLDFFTLDCWTEARDRKDLKIDSKVLSYGVPFEKYNAAMKEFKTFEQWYASDMKNKTAESARTLHEKKNAAADLFKGLMESVIGAKTILERDLLAEKILTPQMIFTHTE